MDFKLHKRLAAGEYRLVVSGAGIRSEPFCVRFTADRVRTAAKSVSISCQSGHDKDDGNDDIKIANK